MEAIPEPEIMKLDPNDENLILGIPEDISPNVEKEEPARRRVKIQYYLLIVFAVPTPRFLQNCKEPQWTRRHNKN